MALVTRLSRLFQADFHAVLDRIEEPDLQLRQAVREMQFTLDQDQQRLKLLQHEAAQLDKASRAASANLEGYDEELDICLAAKKDDLARDLIRRKLVSEKQLQALQQQFASVELQRQNLEKQIDEENQQLTSMKQKLELLVSDDEGFNRGEFNHADTIRSEEIEIALLREKERRARA
jgi:phage shock protein A